MSARVARLALGLRRRHNDTLARCDAAKMAAQWRLPKHFVARMIAEEVARRMAE